MIIIADDYILLFTSLAAVIWGLARYLLAPRAVLPGAADARRLSIVWAVQGIGIDFVGTAVLLVVMLLGTENAVSDVVSLSAAALYGAFALFLPRRGYKPNLSWLDRAILLALAVLLLTGTLYDKFAG